MSNAVVSQTDEQSLIQFFAEKNQITPKVFFDTLKTSIMKGKNVSNEQMALFLMICKKYELDPIVGHVHCVPLRGAVIPIVSIDGWVQLLHNNRECNGIRLDENFDKNGNLESVTCHIYKKGWEHPVSVTEYFKECNQNNQVWKQYPTRMLRHKALIQCARVAFGYSKIYDQDEADRIIKAKNGTIEDGIIEDKQLNGVVKTEDESAMDDLKKMLDVPNEKEEKVVSKKTETAKKVAL